jgi:hypothetical protein
MCPAGYGAMQLAGDGVFRYRTGVEVYGHASWPTSRENPALRVPESHSAVSAATQIMLAVMVTAPNSWATSRCHRRLKTDPVSPGGFERSSQR